MSNNLHVNANTKTHASSHINQRRKNIISIEKQDALKHKKLLQKIFHPDYILFDWEYFSRELEFE